MLISVNNNSFNVHLSIEPLEPPELTIVVTSVKLLVSPGKKVPDESPLTLLHRHTHIIIPPQRIIMKMMNFNYIPFGCLFIIHGYEQVITEQTATSNERDAAWAACCGINNCEIDCHHFAAEVFYLHQWREKQNDFIMSAQGEHKTHRCTCTHTPCRPPKQ